jgi:hypothetical protein
MRECARQDIVSKARESSEALSPWCLAKKLLYLNLKLTRLYRISHTPFLSSKIEGDERVVSVNGLATKLLEREDTKFKLVGKEELFSLEQKSQINTHTSNHVLCAFQTRLHRKDVSRTVPITCRGGSPAGDWEVRLAPVRVVGAQRGGPAHLCSRIQDEGVCQATTVTTHNLLIAH